MYASPSLPSPMAQQHIREAHHQRKPGELEDDGGIIAWVDATLAEKPARVLGPRVSVLGTKRACIGSITKLMHGSASTPSLSKKSHPQRQRGIPGEQQLRSHAYTSEQRGMLNAEQEQMGKGDQFWGIDAQAASEEESRDAMKIEDKFGRLLREYQKDLERLRELEEEMKIQKQKDAQARAEAEELARQLYLKDFYAEPSNLQAAAPFHSIAVGSPLHVANCCRNQQRRRVSFLGMSAGVSTEVLIAGSTQNESRPSSCSQYSLQNLSYKKKYQAYRRQRADMANASTSSESTHHNLDLNVESQLIHKVFAGIGAKAEEGMPVKEFLLRVRSMPSSAEALQRTMLWLIIKRRIWDELGGPSSVTVKALLEWSKLLGTQSHVPARLVRPMIEGHEVGMPCYPAFHVGEEVKVLAHGGFRWYRAWITCCRPDSGEYDISFVTAPIMPHPGMQPDLRDRHRPIVITESLLAMHSAGSGTASHLLEAAQKGDLFPSHVNHVIQSSPDFRSAIKSMGGGEQKPLSQEEFCALGKAIVDISEYNRSSL